MTVIPSSSGKPALPSRPKILPPPCSSLVADSSSCSAEQHPSLSVMQSSRKGAAAQQEEELQHSSHPPSFAALSRKTTWLRPNDMQMFVDSMSCGSSVGPQGAALLAQQLLQVCPSAASCVVTPWEACQHIAVVHRLCCAASACAKACCRACMGCVVVIASTFQSDCNSSECRRWLNCMPVVLARRSLILRPLHHLQMLTQQTSVLAQSSIMVGRPACSCLIMTHPLHVVSNIRCEADVCTSFSH